MPSYISQGSVIVRRGTLGSQQHVQQEKELVMIHSQQMVKTHPTTTLVQQVNLCSPFPVHQYHQHPESTPDKG